MTKASHLLMTAKMAGPLLLLAGCATPETTIDFGYDPETKIVTGKLRRGWMSGPVSVAGEYRAPDGTVVEFVWTSDVDLSAALQDRESTRKAIGEAAAKLAEAAKGAAIP